MIDYDSGNWIPEEVSVGQIFVSTVGTPARSTIHDNDSGIWNPDEVITLLPVLKKLLQVTLTMILIQGARIWMK